MPEVHTTLRDARTAYAMRDWAAAHERFRIADDHGTLSAEDLDAMSDAAWWLGDFEEALILAERAHHAHLDRSQPRQAAMAALGVAYMASLQGRQSAAAGWMGVGQQLLADQPECLEQGYLQYVLAVEGGLDGGDVDAVVAAARNVRQLGRRYGDPNLVAAAAVGEGRMLLRHGRVADGMELLDQAMVAVLSGQMGPDWAGNAYCHVMAAFHELCDVARAREWTEATTRWLETLPAAVLFTAICRVHRSQVLQLAGRWDQARSEAQQVCEDVGEVHVATAAEGHYQVGELLRLRGDLDGAEQAYQRAHTCGRDPQPGLALLLLARGRTNAAAASVRAAMIAQRDNRLVRARLCVAQVEIALADEDLPAAVKACEELEETAAVYATSGLQAMAAQVRGAVQLAEGHAAEALPTLREAARAWRQLAAPYEGARVGLLLSTAYRLLEDHEAAARESSAAQQVLTRLGAAVLAGQDLDAQVARPRPGGLSAREVEVLGLVAAGLTNREVAGRLGISEKTVARHLGNIFTKLGLTSRTQAVAYAFAHHLVTPAAADC